MTRTLAQAITLPGSTTPIPYPTEMQKFIFQGTKGNIGSIINAAIPLVLGIAGLALLVMLIMGGFTLLTSAGDAKKLEQGKQQLTFGLVGFLIIITAYFLVQITGTIFGLSSIQNIFK